MCSSRGRRSSTAIREPQRPDRRETNPRYYALLEVFKRRTGCAVLVNTSFNVRGEPTVCTPEDAFRCFMGTGMETLVVGDCIQRKADQDKSLAKDHSAAFEAG